MMLYTALVFRYALHKGNVSLIERAEKDCTQEIYPFPGGTY
jgi:hypothetical protein